MRQSKKILSFLLAIVLILTTVAIGASAKSAPFKDSAIAGQYNSLDKPVLTTEQYATAALDEVDRMLAEEQLKFTKDDIVVGDLDLTSVDNALDSVVALVEGSLWQNFKGMLGDLYNLNVNAIKTHRRRSTSSTDLDVINSLLQFLYDNKQLFVDFVSGDIDLGSIVGMFVDLSNFNVSKMAKGFIYEFAYDKDAPDNVTQSVDQMAQDIIDKYVVNGYVKNGVTVAPLAPELKGHTNISSGSAYDFVDTALKMKSSSPWLTQKVSQLSTRLLQSIPMKYLLMQNISTSQQTASAISLSRPSASLQILSSASLTTLSVQSSTPFSPMNSVTNGRAARTQQSLPTLLKSVKRFSLIQATHSLLLMLR